MALSLQVYAYGLFSLAVLSFFFFLVIKPLLTYLRDPLNLRKYPSPSPLTALSSLWLVHATWSQKRTRIIHAAHQRLGDVIRVSPNHLLFNDPAAIKDIYGVLAASQGVNKDEFYDRVAGDAHDLVQLRDRGEHGRRRKALANAFAAKTVVNMEAVIRNALRELLVRIDKVVDEKSGDGDEIPVVNLRLWFNYFTLDVIGDMGFGVPMGFVRSLSDATVAESQGGRTYAVASLITSLHSGVRYGLSLGNLHSHALIQFAKRLVSFIPPLAARLGSVGGSDFEDICIRKLRQRIDQGPPTRSSGDFMGFILDDASPVENGKATVQKGGGASEISHATFRSLVADSMMMMNAGSDTTASALTSTTWFLLQNPHALDRLRRELADAAAGNLAVDSAAAQQEDAIFPYETVKDLPFLRACIDETLRLRPPLAYALPRLVSRPTTIAGHTVLPGTVVAVSPYSIHRHASLFRDPDAYRPERWVDFDAEFPQQREDLKKYNIVFSQGSRACIGRHLAIVELQILVATFVMRYELELVGGSKAGLEIFDRFNSNPGPMFVGLRRRVGEVAQ
ncbi:cytochrome P450 [Aspergillus pseudoustus]|uniref:Cytochrome P450 n=1 Tax=Aspergillus pseudoustus TaxID=1810923 RepID=A0ABR4ID68_9EURO